MANGLGPVVEVALAGLATALATGLGALPVARGGDAIVAWRAALLGAAAAAMTVVSFLGLLRPALAAGAPAAVAAGLVAGVLFLLGARAVLGAAGTHHRRLGTAGRRRAALVFLVLFVHSLPEGLAIGSAWAAEPSGLGVFVLVAIAVQNVPEGTVTAIPLAAAGAGPMRQFLAAIATSLPQPVGAVIAFLLVEQVTGLLPLSFAFAAGAMLALVVGRPRARRVARRGAAAGGRRGRARRRRDARLRRVARRPVTRRQRGTVARRERQASRLRAASSGSAPPPTAAAASRALSACTRSPARATSSAIKSASVRASAASWVLPTAPVSVSRASWPEARLLDLTNVRAAGNPRFRPAGCSSDSI